MFKIECHSLVIRRICSIVGNVLAMLRTLRIHYQHSFPRDSPQRVFGNGNAAAAAAAAQRALKTHAHARKTNRSAAVTRARCRRRRRRSFSVRVQ